MTPLVIAHRTCPKDGSENSLEGITRARELGADVVEIDVRRTRDGVPVLLHDKWLLRTTWWPVRLSWVGSAWVARRSLRGGGTIPTLSQALSAAGSELGLAIDVKDRGAGPAVLDVIDRSDAGTTVLFWSQHDEAIETAVDLAPDLEISLLRDTRTPKDLDRFILDARSLGVDGISAHWSQVSPHLAEVCLASGLRLYAWCKSAKIDPRKARLLDGLVTDWPQEGRAAITPPSERPGPF
ncbi:MAG: glycerophosphodiester phosphodiesterase [Actinomycetia bacterium]|nr:glycerophosphodiester phosphodiesterase [Actinomycetes bacterium]